MRFSRFLALFLVLACLCGSVIAGHSVTRTRTVSRSDVLVAPIDAVQVQVKTAPTPIEISGDAILSNEPVFHARTHYRIHRPIVSAVDICETSIPASHTVSTVQRVHTKTKIHRHRESVSVSRTKTSGCN